MSRMNWSADRLVHDGSIHGSVLGGLQLPAFNQFSTSQHTSVVDNRVRGFCTFQSSLQPLQVIPMSISYCRLIADPDSGGSVDDRHTRAQCTRYLGRYAFVAGMDSIRTLFKGLSMRSAVVLGRGHHQSLTTSLLPQT